MANETWARPDLKQSMQRLLRVERAAFSLRFRKGTIEVLSAAMAREWFLMAVILP
jgi:hypothetical protein